MLRYGDQAVGTQHRRSGTGLVIAGMIAVLSTPARCENQRWTSQVGHE